jgi:hypothetical protein
MLHTFKKKYVDEDEQRKTSDLLSEHIRRETERLTTNVSRAAEMLQHRKDELQRQHDEAMVASHQHVLEVSRAYREAIGKHVETLQLSVQGTHVLAQGLKDEARSLKEVIVSSNIVPSLKLDGQELGYVKQLKELRSAAATMEATLNELRVKRAAILDDGADTKLGLKDKAVFQYREERRLQYYQHGSGMDEDEVAFNTQYDSEQFFLVQKLLEKGDNNDNEGHGSAEQGHR